MIAVATAAPPVLRALPRLAEATGRVVCIATGPSLTQADVDYVRGKATVIVVNDAHQMAPWADVLWSSDRYWWKYHKCVPSFTGIKAGIEYSPGRGPEELRKWAPELYILSNTGHDGIELNPEGLRTCGANSGGAAVNLAVHLGALEIVLLGYDMGDTTGQGHFFGQHPAPLSNSHNFPRWRQAFATMAQPLQDAGVSVVNCSRTTSLSCFPCADLETVL